MNINPSRRYPEVASDLCTYILREGMAAGDKLPAERHLAEYFDVSRALLREALIMLEIQGIVDVRQGSGVYIVKLPERQNAEDNDIGPFELLQARQVLESAVAEVAAMTATPRDINALQRILKQQEAEIARGITDYASDEQFHLRLAKATHNRVLEETVAHLWHMRKRSPMWAQLHTHITHTTYWQQWTEDHRAIFNALKRKDAPAAKQAMWQHMENVRDTVLALSDSDSPGFDGFLFQSLTLNPSPQTEDTHL